MKDDAPTQHHRSLRRLSIDKSQRPVHSHRPLLVLLIVAVGVGGIGGGAGWWYFSTTGVNIMAAVGEKAVTVSLYEIPRPGSADGSKVALVANGKIVSDVRVYVATKVSGQIVELNVEQGDSVEEGQVLARVEDVVYRAQRDEANARTERLRRAIEQSQSEYRRQLAAIDEAQAEYEWRKYNFGRLQKLSGTENASDVELVQARHVRDGAAAALEVAKAAAESTKNSIEVSRAELEAAEAVLTLWQKRLNDCAICAPITGVVLERNAQVGDFLAAEGGRGANANAQLVSIADMTKLRVEIDISERDIHRISAGQRAKITPDAYKSQTFEGYVMWIDPLGDYARAIVQVKVRIENPTPNLRIEGSAKVEFIAPVDESDTFRADAFWLPLDAVKIPVGEGKAEVFTVVAGRASAAAVTIGARTDKSVEVTSGVIPGMRIIADELDEIQDGTPVDVQ